MLSRLTFPLLAALALSPASAFAEPAPKTVDAADSVPEPDPPAGAAAVSVVLAALFPTLRSAGPRRGADASPALVDARRQRPKVLDWTSPVFVWIEEGYAYAETSVAF